MLQQPSTCNTYRAIEQANSSRAHLDVTGIVQLPVAMDFSFRPQW
jgi:hypothetical protein